MPVTNVNVMTDRASKNKAMTKLQLFIHVPKVMHVTVTSIHISYCAYCKVADQCR